MEYISVKEVSKKWGISPRRVQVLCNEGRINGATKVGNIWIVPVTAQKPNPANKRKIESNNTQQYKDQIKIRNNIKKNIPLAIKWLESNGVTGPYREIILASLSVSILSKLNYRLDDCSIIFKWFGLPIKFYSTKQISGLLPLVDIEINSPNEVTNVISWAYQYLNIRLTDNKYKSTQFFTENYMVKYLTNTLDHSLNGKVTDICCGGGNFLSYALIRKINQYDHITKERILTATGELYGYDLDYRIARVAYVNIVLTAVACALSHGIRFDEEELKLIMPEIYVNAEHNFQGSLNSNIIVYRLNDDLCRKKTLIDALGNANFLLTNPPFATIKGMEVELRNYLKEKFPNANCDLCAAFLEKSFDYLADEGKLGIVVQNSWMFLDSLTDLRSYLLQNCVFEKIIDLGSSAFIDLNGEKSSVALIIASHKSGLKKVKKAIGYTNFAGRSLLGKEAGINELLKDGNNILSKINPEDVIRNENHRFDFMNIGKFRSFYYDNTHYCEYAVPMQGTSTGNSKELVDYFWNHFNDHNWRLVSKGGGYCRWRGLNRYVLKWGKDGEFIKMQKGSALRNVGYFNQTELVFSDTGTSGLNTRLLIPKQLFIASGPGIRVKVGNKYAHLSYLNSRVASYYIQMLTPKLTIAAGYISKLPVTQEIIKSSYLTNLGKLCCDLKEHLLMYRPNNIEYSTNGFIERFESVRDNAIALFMDDMFTNLQLMVSEKKIDDHIVNALGLKWNELFLLRSQMGVQPMCLKAGNKSELDKTLLDATISSLLDATCLLRKNKVQSIRYGADTILEYIARNYSLNPFSLYKNIQKTVGGYNKVLKLYMNLLLHNTVLNFLGYNTITGFAVKSRSVEDVIDCLSSTFNDNRKILENWLRKSFTRTHKKIFMGNELLRLEKERIVSNV